MSLDPITLAALGFLSLLAILALGIQSEDE